MGQHTYLGPYVRVPEKKVPFEEEFFGCSNPKCSEGLRVSFGGAYCSRCGGRNESQTRTVERQVAYYDVIGEELHSVGGSGGYFYLVPNTVKPGDPRPKSRRREADRDEHIHINMYAMETDVDPPLNMHAEVLWFGSAFAVELEKLNAVYGKLLVSWGFHQYVM